MAEEKPIWEQVVDPNTEMSDEGDTSNFSEAEQKAMDKGWVPQDKWQGPQDEWRSAKEFLDRGSFYEKINNQRRELDELRRFQLEAKEHLQKLRESQERDRLMKLEEAKINALQEGDYDRVLNVDREVRKVESEIAQLQQPVTYVDPSVDSRYQEWVQDNPWYTTDKDLHILADALGKSYRDGNPNASADDVYNYVTEKVKQTNPNKFSPPTREAQSRTPDPVNRGTNRSAQGHGFTSRDLNDDQLRVGRRFTKLGLYKSIQEYVDDLAANGDL